MKFMMMMHAPRSGWETDGIGTWPAEDIQNHINYMIAFNKELKASGEFVDAQGLALPAHARIVRANADRSPEVTDGPYPEAKEFLAGFWIIDVDSAARVYELAAQASSAPGKAGAQMSIPIEVREVMSAPPQK